MQSFRSVSSCPAKSFPSIRLFGVCFSLCLRAYDSCVGWMFGCEQQQQQQSAHSNRATFTYWLADDSRITGGLLLLLFYAQHNNNNNSSSSGSAASIHYFPFFLHFQLLLFRLVSSNMKIILHYFAVGYDSFIIGQTHYKTDANQTGRQKKGPIRPLFRHWPLKNNNPSSTTHKTARSGIGKDKLVD